MFGNGRGGLDESHPLASLMAACLPDFRKKRIGRAAEVVGGELARKLDRGHYLTLAQAQWLYDAYLGVLDALRPEPTTAMSTVWRGSRAIARTSETGRQANGNDAPIAKVGKVRFRVASATLRS